MRYAPLIGVSLLTGILWRLELQLRWGWASLDWIGPFHWAFPVAAGVYLVWMAHELRGVGPRSRQIVLAVAFILGLAAYFGGGLTMMWANYRWIGFLPRWQALAFMALPAILYVILGAVYFGTVHRLVSPSPGVFWTSGVCYAVAFPAALFLLWATQHRGGPDVIHAIKSGVVFPIIAFSLGLPVLGMRWTTPVTLSASRAVSQPKVKMREV